MSLQLNTPPAEEPVTFAWDGDGLVLADHETSGVSLVRAQESDLPQVSRITYIDGDQDYRQASVEARRLTGGSNRVASSALALVMDQEQATGIGARLLQDAWVMRESATFTLPPSALALDAGDEVLLDAGGRVYRLRITQIDDAAGRAVEAVATDPSLYDAFNGPVRAPTMAQTIAQAGRVTMEFLDLPLLGSEAKAWAPHAAAFASPWPGKVPLLRSAGDANYQPDTLLTQPAIMGVTTDDFYAGPLWRWDQVNSLKLRLYGGALASMDDASVLGGANAIAVKNAAGAWEVLQFAHAELTGPNEYTLTRLLRGQVGTEAAMGAPAGSRVVVLNDALRQLSLDPAQARLTFNYRWGPASKPMSDSTWQGAALQFDAVGLAPFAPFHVRAQRLAGGDIAISWRRRDRSPAALGWNNAATPMSEAGEAYDLDIINGGVVVRIFSSLTQASLTYTAAQQAADFPAGPPSPLVVRVCQLSSVLGRGHVKEELLYV